MAKMGRPKSDVIKDKIVTIRMSAEEHQKLRDYSEKHQQTITETLKEELTYYIRLVIKVHFYEEHYEIKRL